MSDPDFDARWAEIVADLTADETTSAATEAGAEGDSAEAGADSEVPTSSRADQETDATALGLASLFEPLRRRDATVEPEPSAPTPDPFVDTWQDEGEFVPPPPPSLPEGTPIKRLGWAAMLGGLATLILIGLTGWDAPRIVAIAAGLAFLAGFVTLVWQLPESREDGWDDGAQL